MVGGDDLAFDSFVAFDASIVRFNELSSHTSQSAAHSLVPIIAASPHATAGRPLSRSPAPPPASMISIPHLNSSLARQARRAESDDASPNPSEGVGRPRRARYRSKSCAALARFGSSHSAFQRHSRELRMLSALTHVQRQVEALERRQVLMQSVQVVRLANASAAVASRAEEYYQHFSRGYDPDRLGADACSKKEAVLRALMLEDVQSPAFPDLDTFLVQWRNYSRYHAEMNTNCMHVELMDSEDPDVYIVKCSGLTSLRISRDTITHFFKPILEDEALVQRLIGQEYSFPFATLFYFNATGRVFKLEPRADLAAGLLHLVSDPFATVKLLGASQLSEDGCLHAYAE